MKKQITLFNSPGYLTVLRLTWVLSIMLIFSCISVAQSNEKTKQLDEKPSIEDLGQGRYRIGSIIIDKANSSFQVPGQILRIKPPLEFLAVTKGGMKGYESLLELNVNAFEFNLACILIGLDKDKAKAPEFHFSEQPAEGDPVTIWISWEQDGKIQRIPASSSLLQDKKSIQNDWVYSASGFTPAGEYLASIDGTLVGFVHDPASIIEHRQGLGLGDYGAVSGNAAALPTVGSAISFVVERKVRK